MRRLALRAALGGRHGRFFDETFRVLSERLVESDLTGRMHGVDLAIMHLIRCHQPDPGMVSTAVGFQASKAE